MLHLQVLSATQDPIINVEVSSFFNMKGASFVVDSFEYVVDVVMHCSNSVKPFFCRRGGGCVVVIKVHGAWIKAIETSVGRKFVGSRGYNIKARLYEK